LKRKLFNPDCIQTRRATSFAAAVGNQFSGFKAMGSWSRIEITCIGQTRIQLEQFTPLLRRHLFAFTLTISGKDLCILVIMPLQLLSYKQEDFRKSSPAGK